MLYAPGIDRPGGFPFVSFLHGVLDDNYIDLMETVASYGFVVSNLQNCDPACKVGDLIRNRLSAQRQAPC
jgi:hypothetical protein